MKITVAELIAELRKYPQDAYAYAYEGEITGVVIVEHELTVHPNGSSGRKELGYILAENS